MWSTWSICNCGLNLSSDCCLCLCVCQTNLHMRVARQTHPIRQKLCTLHSTKSRGGSAAGRSATPEPSARKYVSALCSKQHSFQLGSQSSDSLRAALSICRRLCHQITRQLGAFVAKSSMSLEDQHLHGHSITLRFLHFSSNLCLCVSVSLNRLRHTL